MLKTDVIYQTLSQYLTEIKELIQEVSDYQWIIAEIAKIDCDKNGHYWIELVEKKTMKLLPNVVRLYGVVMLKQSLTFTLKQELKFKRV